MQVILRYLHRIISTKKLQDLPEKAVVAPKVIAITKTIVSVIKIFLVLTNFLPKIL